MPSSVSTERAVRTEPEGGSKRSVTGILRPQQDVQCHVWAARKPASLLCNAGQHPRWEPSWEPSALDCCGRVWTRMDIEGFRSRLCGRLWTARDTAWRSTDQKVVGSSPAGRAERIPYVKTREFSLSLG